MTMSQSIPVSPVGKEQKCWLGKRWNTARIVGKKRHDKKAASSVGGAVLPSSYLRKEKDACGFLPQTSLFTFPPQSASGPPF